MNNDAFASLVRHRATASTREFARQAVESDFKRKNKRQQRHGGNNEDGSSDEEASDKRRKKQRQRDGDQEEDKDMTSEQENASTYRDRAKERREGKTDELTRDNDLRHYEKDAPTLDDDLEQAWTHGLKKRQHVREHQTQENLSHVPNTKEEAEFLILNDQIQAQTDLGRDLLAYCKSKLQPAPTMTAAAATPTNAGRLVQRTILEFAADMPDPRNRSRAWLVPMERTLATFHTDADDTGVVLKASPVTPSLLQSIKDALWKPLVKHEREKDRTKALAVDIADDSDDDIFNNAGSDYQPTLEQTTNISSGTLDETHGHAAESDAPPSTTQILPCSLGSVFDVTDSG
ncbi:hypothetical protein MPSEU_001016500 [Mayamaea pseudoterrestris]|nr:hypothetical protein MPSEU_001016500 [Mayamaea pseudoterrestris]